MTMSQQSQSEAQLLRIPYYSKATQAQREYFLYLPAGYETDTEKRWPVMLFLHGGGERGNGREDLDYVLVHGPLGEAWIQGRNLPFIIIGPQLPIFGMEDQLRSRESTPKPQRLPSGPPPRADEGRPDQPPLARQLDPTPSVYGVTEAWPAPGGWHLCEEEVMAMVDRTLAEYRADPDRVYLTGISYGGYGTWHLATTYPERWAAIAPICGNGKPELAHRLAERQMPIWIFQGGRDVVIKADMIYKLAAALEQAGHRTVRLTIHEDLGHDCWTRVYAGEDLYQWLLSHRLK
jgi:predicted peptidase